MTDDRVLSVTFLDVGQGDATIIVPPEAEGDPIVFDCGDGWVLNQQLKAWKVSQLEAVIASHLDFDHIAGMADILTEFKGRLRAVYLSADRDVSDQHQDARKAKALLDQVNEGDGHSWEVREVHRDRRSVASGRDWSVELVAPRASVRQRVHREGRWEDANRYSAVLRVRMAGTVLLVGGDAPLLTWSELPDDELRARIFRVPHHGGALDDGGVPEGWSPEVLYDRVSPLVTVVSVGRSNRHGHPEAGRWLAPVIGRSGCRLLCTQVTGRCHPPFARSSESSSDTSGNPLREELLGQSRERWLPNGGNGLSHFAEPPWRHYVQDSKSPLGRRRTDRAEVPCAGTISVRIDERGEVLIDPAADNPSLAARIGEWADPLCQRERNSSRNPQSSP